MTEQHREDDASLAAAVRGKSAIAQGATGHVADSTPASWNHVVEEPYAQRIA